MKLLVYAAPAIDAARDLLDRIRSSGLHAGVETVHCPSLSSLDEQLRRPLGISPIGILIPSTESELAALIGMRHLLRDIRLILILTGSLRPDTPHARAHMLRPRFVSVADKNLDEVTAVLWKMMDTACGIAV
jgi:hypothetical protein